MSHAVETFLARLRGSHPDMTAIFTRGSCYELYEIMRVIWPDAEPHYHWVGGHVYVKIGHWFYDINGRHRRLPDGYTSDMRKEWTSDRPHRWSKRTKLRVVDAGMLIDPADGI